MPVLNVREAVNASVTYFQEIQDLIGNQVENLRLEEAELSEDRQKWLITLGFDIPIHRELSRDLSIGSIGSIVPTQDKYKYRREYKLFQVDAATGEIEAMKIREV